MTTQLRRARKKARKLIGKPVAEPVVTRPNPFQMMILRALQDRPLYLGTASVGDVNHRRAKNKRAKLSRKINRGR